MRKGFYITLICCMAYTTFAQLKNVVPSLIQISTVSFIAQEQVVKPFKSVDKKRDWKERMQKRFLQLQLKKKTPEADRKKAVKLLGYLSILTSLLGPFILLLAFVSASPGIFVALGIALSLTAVILGLLSLKKRKALADKTGTSNVAAWIGIILGGLFILALVSLFASVRFNPNTF